MNIDRKIHEVVDFIQGRDIRWHDFNEVGSDEAYYDYYYAEDRLYLIRDRISEQIYFVESSCPVEALNSLKDIFEAIATPADPDEPKEDWIGFMETRGLE